MTTSSDERGKLPPTMQPGPQTRFATMVACAAGGATFGSVFEMPGLLAGGLLGGLIGWFANRHHAV